MQQKLTKRRLGFWVGFFLLIPLIIFSEVFAEMDGQDRLSHLSEKYPETPELAPMPTLKIRGFGDLSFFASKQDHEYESAFNLGNINLLITSKINEKLSFLSELAPYRDVYFLENTNPGFGNSSYFEFQRFALKYTISDALNIRVGRYHTALGYWNHTYHHGTWLQPSILRPEIYRFEFQGGILPEHSVGLEIFGFKEVRFFDLRYHIGISNGRGEKLWVVQNFNDENRSKALTLFWSAEPHFIEGLRFGTTFYMDTVPEDKNDPSQANATDEKIFGSHLIYIGERIEFLSEFFKIYHAETNTGQDYVTEGGYVHANMKMKTIIAYYRYDFIDFAENNPVFWGFQRDVKKHTVGVRWDIFPWNALKFEIGRVSKKDRAPEHVFGVNTSFTF